MTALVFGATGQVASELKRLTPEATFLGRDRANLNDPAACEQAILDHNPAYVINAAAWTAVDQAEAHEEEAAVVNGASPTAMAKACHSLDIPFVHVSTDYVFDGAGEMPFTPEQAASPLGAYGRTKLIGEEGVRAVGGCHAILRTSWVFSAHGNNFLKTMVRLGKERDHLNVVSDQCGGPTPASGIASACIAIATQLAEKPSKSGTYHYSGAPDTNWSGFAREIMAQAGLQCVVSDIPSSEFPTPAKRPANSRMDCSSLSVFGLERPDWKRAVTEILTELGVNQ